MIVWIMVINRHLLFAFLLAATTFSLYAQEQETQYLKEREEMVLSLKKKIRDPRVLQALMDVPRHLFVPEEYTEMAYDTIPIPLDDQRILPSPEILSLVFDAAKLNLESRVLVVGSACGYSAAILSNLVETVHVIDPFYRVVLPNPRIRISRSKEWTDWTAQGPYDFIFVQDAVGVIPVALTSQLADGGRMVFPILTDSGFQALMILTRYGDGFEIRALGEGFFTPRYQ